MGAYMRAIYLYMYAQPSAQTLKKPRKRLISRFFTSGSDGMRDVVDTRGERWRACARYVED